MAVPFERRAGAWPRMLSITRSDAGAAGAGKTESHAPGGMFARTQNIAKPNPKSFVNRKRAIDENEGTFLYKIQLHGR